MRVRRLVVLGGCLGVLGGILPTGASAWQVTLGGGNTAALDRGTAGALAPSGDVIAAGSAKGRLLVMRLSADRGSARWKRTLDGIPGPALALDPGGDVLAAARLANGSDTELGVVKLDGATGVEAWRYTAGGSAPGGTDAPFAVAVGATGDVAVAGVVENAGTGGDFTVARLDGATGAEAWKVVLHVSGDDEALAVAVDPNGDVVAAGEVGGGTPDPDAYVLKLDGATGAEVWHARIDVGDDRAHALALDGTDVVVALAANLRFNVRRLAAADGAELWSYTRNDAGPARAVAVDGAGDVLATGTGLTAKVDGAAGTETWAATGAEEYAAVAAAASGDAVVAGATSPDPVNARFAVAVHAGDTGTRRWAERLDEFRTIHALGTDGAGRIAIVGGDSRFVTAAFDERLAGTRLSVKDAGVGNAGRRITFTSRDGLGLAGAAGGPGDAGLFAAVLELWNPDTHEVATFTLPAVRWRVTSGKASGSELYRYRDPGRVDGPCSSVVVRNAKSVLVRCTGAGIPFSLDEPAQGRLAIRLRLGSGIARCSLFGGTIARDVPRSGSAAGAFEASHAPAPATCPAL